MANYGSMVNCDPWYSVHSIIRMEWVTGVSWVCLCIHCNYKCGSVTVFRVQVYFEINCIYTMPYSMCVCVWVCVCPLQSSVFLYFQLNCIHTTVCVCIHCTVSMYPLQLRVWPRASVKPLLCLDGSSCLSPPCHPPAAACNT